MVYILLILLFISDKNNSFKDQTNKNVKHTLLTEFFWLAKERKIRTRNKGINKRSILSSLFFKCFFRFQLEMASFTMMRKMFPLVLNMKKRRDYQNFNICITYDNFDAKIG